MDNKLSKPVAWDFPGSKEESRQLGYDFELDDEQKVNCSPLYSQEYVSALLAERDAFEASALAMRDEWRAQSERIAELEAKLATPVIGSCDSDPMREYFTCNREGDFYFTTLGSVPGRTYTLYRNEAEALFIGLRDALSAGFTVEGDE